MLIFLRVHRSGISQEKTPTKPVKKQLTIQPGICSRTSDLYCFASARSSGVLLRGPIRARPRRHPRKPPRFVRKVIVRSLIPGTGWVFVASFHTRVKSRCSLATRRIAPNITGVESQFLPFVVVDNRASMATLLTHSVTNRLWRSSVRVAGLSHGR